MKNLSVQDVDSDGSCNGRPVDEEHDNLSGSVEQEEEAADDQDDRDRLLGEDSPCDRIGEAISLVEVRLDVIVEEVKVGGVVEKLDKVRTTEEGNDGIPARLFGVDDVERFADVRRAHFLREALVLHGNRLDRAKQGNDDKRGEDNLCQNVEELGRDGK